MDEKAGGRAEQCVDKGERAGVDVDKGERAGVDVDKGERAGMDKGGCSAWWCAYKNERLGGAARKRARGDEADRPERGCVVWARTTVQNRQPRDGAWRQPVPGPQGARRAPVTAVAGTGRVRGHPHPTHALICVDPR